MYGGGAGSILHMINSYKENRELLKRIKPFKRQRDHEIELLSRRKNIMLKFRKISELDLKILRRKLKREFVRETLVYVFVSLIILLLIPVFLSYIL